MVDFIDNRKNEEVLPEEILVDAITKVSEPSLATNLIMKVFRFLYLLVLSAVEFVGLILNPTIDTAFVGQIRNQIVLNQQVLAEKSDKRLRAKGVYGFRSRKYLREANDSFGQFTFDSVEWAMFEHENYYRKLARKRLRNLVMLQVVLVLVVISGVVLS